MIIAQIAQTGGQKTEISTTNHLKTEISMVWKSLLLVLYIYYRFGIECYNIYIIIVINSFLFLLLFGAFDILITSTIIHEHTSIQAMIIAQ